MITLSETADLLERYGVKDGFIVGGIVEHGFSDNDIDIITGTELPAPFHTIKDSTEPQGPSVDVKKLAAVKKFLDSFKFMKPAKTESESQEYYDINAFKGFKGEYSVEPKWDGIRAVAAKVGTGILIRTDEGRSIEDKLPNIAEDLRRVPYDTAILDCELVIYIRDRRGDHSDVTAYLNSKSPAEDYHIKLKPFDMVYADGEDVRAKPLRERKELLVKVAWSQHVHPTKFTVAKDSAIIPAIMEMATNEGAMVKDMTGTYNVQGKGWWKWKRQFDVDAKVTAVKKIAGGYVYTCEAGGGEIGDTYATNIEAKVGDIITVSVDKVTKREGKDGGFTWYAPKVTAVRKDKTAPDTVAVLEKMAAEKKVETNAADPEKGQEEPVLEGDFVLHEHWWGEKHHFDLRFRKINTEGKAVMIGFTLFADSEEELKSKLANGEKILAKEKEYHAPEWLTFHGDIPPGQTGNPTKNLTAHMEIRDRGHYTFAKRQSDFVDMTLDGNILKGRYYVRKVALKDADEDPNSGPKPGDRQPSGQAGASETTQGKDNKWLFWKAKENKADSADRVMFADSMGIRIDSSRLVDTKDGLLVKDAVICRAMVLDYQGKKVLKSPEVLAESMPTMQRMMVTDEHPRSRVIIDVSEIKGRVLPETVRLRNDVATGDLLITDKALADKVRKGKRDLSPGYFADIIEEPGTFNDEPYEAAQKNVLYDHLAVVKLGRCPRPKCGIVDSADCDLQEGDLEMVTQIQDEATLASHMAAYKAMMTSMEEMLKQAPAATRSQMVTLLNKMKSLMGMIMALGDSDGAKSPQFNYNPDKGRLSSMMGMMAEMERMMSELPEDLKKKMLEIHDKIKSTMAAMDSEQADVQDAPLVDEAGKLLPAVKATMPAEAVQLYEKTYATVKAGACKDKTGFEAFSCPIKAAWAAVKSQFVKGADGKWAKKTADSSSSIIDEEKAKETKETMAESIVVDGVGYTPEMVKKLVADSAALSEAQKLAAETRKLLDAKEAAFAEQGKALAASEANAAAQQAQIDSMEQERRTPVIKKITDAMPALKAEDLKAWDMKRLTETVDGFETAAKLKQKNDASSGKSPRAIIDEAYARKERGGI